MDRFLFVLVSLVVLIETVIIFKLKQEEKDMVALYVALIIAGRRTFAQVPARYQDYVREDLAALGLDEDGNPIEV